jgi:hypothetical protein
VAIAGTVLKIFELYSTFSIPLCIITKEVILQMSSYLRISLRLGRKMQRPNTGIWRVTTVLLGLGQLSIRT